MIAKYLTYDLSKLYLAEMILNSKTQDNVIRNMDTILFKNDLEAIFKLKSDAQRMKPNIQKLYVEGLAALNTLLPYFEREEVESNLRNLSLWRQPIAELRTREVLKYLYSIDETWRTWPTSVSLGDLITPEGSKYISDILNGYMEGIYEALFEVQHTSLLAKEDAVNAFVTLWSELQLYKKQSQIDDNFVR